MTVERANRDSGDGAGIIEGPVGTLLGDEPHEVYLRRRRGAGGPAYVRVRRGDLLIEGDRPVPGPGRPGPGMDRWRVTAVTPDVVAARHVETGRSAAWDRSHVERALATGALSTSLGGFESVVVAGNAGPRGRTRVVALGDDGRRYERIYAGGSGRATLRLLRENAAASGLGPGMHAALDEVVADAIDDGKRTAR